MKSFVDTAGRTWSVDVQVDGIKRVRSLLGIDLLTILDDGCQLLARLHDDPVLLVDVLYALCKPQAESQSLRDEDFGRAMSGDALLQAHQALLEGLSDFFPNARQRAVLKELLQKTQRMVDQLLTHAETTVAALDPASAAASVIASFGSSPAASASTPVPTP